MMDAYQNLKTVFEELDARINSINEENLKDGLFRLPMGHVKILGQMSLMVNQKVSATLSLINTSDLDALLNLQHVAKQELKIILIKHGLVYDEDSYLVWIPPGANFEKLFQFSNILVEVLDPESALVSKAVKAPDKNKVLIREAIASEKFPHLVERILKNKGNLENFL